MFYIIADSMLAATFQRPLDKPYDSTDRAHSSESIARQSDTRRRRVWLSLAGFLR